METIKVLEHAFLESHKYLITEGYKDGQIVRKIPSGDISRVFDFKAEETLINNIKKVDFPWHIAEIVFQYHERINGSGYPNNLKGDEIILEAKIIGVADVVEAMSSHRPYRPALGIDVALEEISQNKGILYDPEVVDICLKLFKEKGFKFK